LIVERCQDDRRTELPFVEQVARDFVIGIDPGLEARQDNLRAA
jgi:hypothetical protein